VLEVSCGSYNDFNLGNIKCCLSPLNQEAIINYDLFRLALEKNFAACELTFVFCKSDSDLAKRNQEAVNNSSVLFELFKKARI
jgi:hypothetical protein